MSEVTGEFTAKKQEIEKQRDRILRAVGLNLKELEEKNILDVGAGDRYLERGIKEAGINAHIISLDSDIHSLQLGGEMNENVVVSDVSKEKLPFPDDTFDLIVNNGGPLRGGPNEESLKRYLEALRVLKVDGELHSSIPFLDSNGGIADYLYAMAKDDVIEVDPSVIKDYERKLWGQNEPELSFDEENVPLDSGFWEYCLGLNSKEDQEGFWQMIAFDLSENLKEEGNTVSIDLVDRNISDSHYSPYMVMKKLHNN